MTGNLGQKNMMIQGYFQSKYVIQTHAGFWLHASLLKSTCPPSDGKC